MKGNKGNASCPVYAKTISPERSESPQKQAHASPLAENRANGIALNVRKATSPETQREEESSPQGFAIQVEYVEDGPTPDYDEVDTDFSNFSKAADSRAGSVRSALSARSARSARESFREDEQQMSQQSPDSVRSRLEPY